MTPQSIRFLLRLAIALSILLPPAHAADPVNKTEQRIELLESQIKALDEKTQIKLEANEKLIQAKVDQAAAIAQNLENGRKDVDWWLSLLAAILAVASLAALAVPAILHIRMKGDFSNEVAGVRKIFEELRLFEREAKSDVRQAMTELREIEKNAKAEIHQAMEELREIEKLAKGKLQNIEHDAEKAKAARAEMERLKSATVEGKSPDEMRQLVAEAEAADDTPEIRLLTRALEYAEAGQWAEAAIRWRALTDLEPESANHWFNLGYVLQKQAEADVESKLDLIKRACEAYAEAVRSKPDMHEAYNNWGNALADWAIELAGEARQAKSNEACEKFAEAARIRPDYYEAYYNWGIALDGWAHELAGEARQSKFAEACEKYAEAVRIKPDKHAAYNNWGSALDDWAHELAGEARRAKLAEACEKYAEAVRIKPDMHEAYNNWGRALLLQMSLLEGEARAAKLQETKGILLKAESLQAGAGAYNLACAAALSGQPDEAREWLNKARQAGNKSANNCERLKTDTDLDSLRDLPWFKAFLAEVCDKDKPA